MKNYNSIIVYKTMKRHVHCSEISVEQYQNGDNQTGMSIDDHNKMTRIKELTTTITDVIRLHD